MNKTAVASFNIVSALGSGADVNFDQMLKGISGVREHNLPDIDAQPVWVSLVTETQLGLSLPISYSHYEKLLIASIKGAQDNSSLNLSGDDTLFVFSTTKGSIALLESEAITPELMEKLSLFNSASLVAKYFGNNNQPVVISNACISGVVALLYAKRMLDSGQFGISVLSGAQPRTLSSFFRNAGWHQPRGSGSHYNSDCK
jgi:3-oxoacyl-[acyl-carrier-protein] synthase I